MADTTAAPPSPWFDVMKAAMPYIGQAMILLITFGTGIGAALLTQHVRKDSLPIAAADPPRPVPMVSVSDVDHSLQTHCGEIRTLLLERLPAPKKAPIAR